MANLPKFVNAETKTAFMEVKDNHFYNVVFIEDSKEIYTHGVFYGISPSDVTALQNLITAAQTAADNAQDTADSALQSISKGTDGSYFTTTVGTKSGNNGAKSQTISGTIKMQAVSSAGSTAKGVAEASDVKAYVDGLLTWVEL